MNTLLFLLSSYTLINSFDMINDVAASLSIFLFVLSYKYSCQRFLSQKCEFSSCHDQNVWNVPSTSKYSRQFSEDFWTLLKMSEDVLTTFELFWIYLKDDHFCALWYFFCTKSILSTFWNIFREIELNCPYKWYAKKNELQLVSLAWEIVLDAWDCCLQSAGLRLTHNG